VRAARRESSLLRRPRQQWQHSRVIATQRPTKRFALFASLALAAACTSGARVGGSGEGGEGGEAPEATGGTTGTPMPDAAAPVVRKDAAPATGGTGGSGTGGSEPAPPDAAAGGAGGSASPDAAPSATPDASAPAPDAPPASNNQLTAGWTQKTFTFAIHKPYDLDVSQRYTFDMATGVHTLFVLKTDKAHQPNNTTAPRTEIRLQNDYTSGNHQYEADVMVVAGTDGPSIMQVFGGQTNATAFMLKAQNANGGTVRRYDNEVLKTMVYDKWFHLNVIHEALPNGIGKVKVYINGASVGTFDDRNTATHYFKCGVYGPSSARAEARFRDIKYWVK
jgi:hypothetical protein